MTRGAAALAGLLVAAAATVAAADDTPPPPAPPDEAHALFAEGRFAAAAASFEKQFAATANLADGLNAVVAWRAAGRYAHARVLLRALADKHPSGLLASRAQLLETRLAELTGTVAITGTERAVIVKIDGVPAERLGDDVIVDVGMREVTVEAETCEPARSRHVLRPTEHVTVAVKLVCKAYPGSLHVGLAGARGATATIDGTPHEIVDFDLDLPMPSGSHHLVVRRGSIAIADEDVAITANETARRTVDVPWRALAAGLTGAVTTIAHGATGSQGSLVGAVQLGATLWNDSGFALVPWFELGYAANHVSAVPDAPYLGVGLVARIHGPLLQRRFGRTLLTFDADPLAFHAGFSISGSGGTSTSIAYYGLGAATLTLEVPHVHLEAQAWPLGFAENSSGFANTGTHYAGELSLTAGWAFEL